MKTARELLPSAEADATTTRTVRDARAWRELIRTMPLEVQRAIAFGPTSEGRIDVLEPGSKHLGAGMMVVEFLPSKRAALFAAGHRESIVRWGELLAGSEWMLRPVMGRSGELVRFQLLDLRGYLIGNFTPEEGDHLRRMCSAMEAVVQWAKPRRVENGDLAAILDLIDGEALPSAEYLDRLLATVQGRGVTALHLVAEA
jgi:hypothetical protein